MIHVNAITFKFQKESSPVFLDFSWKVDRGESWSILGPSGCGKTTLLYLLAGLLFPSVGAIHIDEEKMVRPRPKTGLILQDYGLLPWATVQENISLGSKVRKFYGADGIHSPLKRVEDKKSVDWIGKLGLESFKNKYPAQLSGGQRQRTAIARTLILQPDLLLMDEPFSSLDAAIRENLQELTLSLLKEEKISLVMVTHSINEALFMGQKVMILAKPPNLTFNLVENPYFGIRNCEDDPGFRNLLKIMGDSSVLMGYDEK